MHEWFSSKLCFAFKVDHKLFYYTALQSLCCQGVIFSGTGSKRFTQEGKNVAYMYPSLRFQLGM